MSTNPDPEVLFFGSYDAELHPRVATLRQGLSATHRVTELNAPLGLSRIGFGLLFGGIWGLYANLRGRWI